jgi:hypothetical protein
MTLFSPGLQGSRFTTSVGWFIRTAATANAFEHLTAAERSRNEVASPTGFAPSRKPVFAGGLNFDGVVKLVA